jgi:zinc D-Ala-D-Ala dipeptidase
MKLIFKIIYLLLIFSLFSCKNNPTETVKKQVQLQEKPIMEVVEEKAIPNDSTFVNILAYSKDFVLDMKYATSDNFLKEKVYDCPDCYLRYKTLKALILANKDFMKLGYKIKMFDCYRPLDIQKKMWKIMPNTNYVANPKKGSMHNRGGAVDITLINAKGKELPMGTAFDFFGPEAGHDYKKLSKKVLDNRKLLQLTMKKHGFDDIKSEWWHYNFTEATINNVSNFKWDCK